MGAAVVLTSFVWVSCGGSPTTPQPTPAAVTLSCPVNVETSSPAGVLPVINYSSPVATGGTGPLTVLCTPPSHTAFPLGLTPVTCTATDAAAQRATCAFSVNVTARPLLSQTRFLAFGDSLTEGKLSVTLELLIDSPAHSYPVKLTTLLAARYPDQQIIVVNEGFAGERVVDSVNRFWAAMAQHRPESVLLMHGVNDLNGLEDGRVQATVDGLEALVKAATSLGVTPFLASLPPIGPPKSGCPECVVPLNERLRSMSASKGAVFVDVYAAWGNRPGLMGADGIHPTEAGYEVIAEAFFEAIRNRLEAAGQ